MKPMFACPLKCLWRGGSSNPNRWMWLLYWLRLHRDMSPMIKCACGGELLCLQSTRHRNQVHRDGGSVQQYGHTSAQPCHHARSQRLGGEKYRLEMSLVPLLSTVHVMLFFTTIVSPHSLRKLSLFINCPFLVCL